ncbi:unnamed protein product [Ranitomeya imitator]|uniref:Uncharacterized protein n=1 Tax=Ranitomeya imitator TaxID=111125 RepID=A0ABN9M4Z3_9NEOB|nr:unnamed protein product [Ranitomeya imitator]
MHAPVAYFMWEKPPKSVKDRISKHKSTIRCKNLLLPIPHHFSSKGHNMSQLRFQVTEQVTTPSLTAGVATASLYSNEEKPSGFMN